MYQIENKSYIYVYYEEAAESWSYKRGIKCEKIEDEKALIKFLANGFRSKLIGWNEYTGEEEYRLVNPRMEYLYCDGYGRKVNPKPYYDDALLFYREHICAETNTMRKPVNRWKSRYKYSFRKGSVECIHKSRGGSNIHPRKIMQGKAAYLDPEQKPYNRGSVKDYPWGWWDDWNRCVERNWKSQRKTRHQWKEK